MLKTKISNKNLKNLDHSNNSTAESLNKKYIPTINDTSYDYFNSAFVHRIPLLVKDFDEKKHNNIQMFILYAFIVLGVIISIPKLETIKKHEEMYFLNSFIFYKSIFLIFLSLCKSPKLLYLINLEEFNKINNKKYYFLKIFSGFTAIISFNIIVIFLKLTTITGILLFLPVCLIFFFSKLFSKKYDRKLITVNLIVCTSIFLLFSFNDKRISLNFFIKVEFYASIQLFINLTKLLFFIMFAVLSISVNIISSYALEHTSNMTKNTNTFFIGLINLSVSSLQILLNNNISLKVEVKLILLSFISSALFLVYNLLQENYFYKFCSRKVIMMSYLPSFIIIIFGFAFCDYKFFFSDACGCILMIFISVYSLMQLSIFN